MGRSTQFVEDAGTTRYLLVGCDADTANANYLLVDVQTLTAIMSLPLDLKQPDSNH